MDVEKNGLSRLPDDVRDRVVELPDEDLKKLPDVFFKKGPSPASYVYFRSLLRNKTIRSTNNVINVHPVSDDEILTHSLMYANLRR